MNNPIASLFKFAFGIALLIVLAIIAFHVFIFALVAGLALFIFFRARLWLVQKGIIKAPERPNPFGTRPDASYRDETSLDDGPTIEGEFEVVNEEEKK